MTIKKPSLWKVFKKFVGVHFMWADVAISAWITLAIHGFFGSAYMGAMSNKFWITSLLGSQLFVILWWWQFTYTFYINPPKGCQGEKWLKLLRKNPSMPKATLVYVRAAFAVALGCGVFVWMGGLVPPLLKLWVAVTALIFLARCWWLTSTINKIAHKKERLPIAWLDRIKEPTDES